MRKFCCALLGVLMVLACAKAAKDNQLPITNTLITQHATSETEALYRNLKILSKDHIMFGHQNTNLYGHSWRDIPGKSDVKDVCGSNPAVYGQDIGDLTMELSDTEYAKREDYLKEKIVEAYDRGAVTTISWHYRNPANNGSFYFEQNPIKALSALLPSGELHEKYKLHLKTIASFASKLKGSDGKLVPVIFRPYHEYEGDWFWWGTPHHCTKEQFIELWRFTITYLRDELKVSNFIYAISPDCRFNTKEEFLDCYPGDEYVDMIGMDNYWDFRPDGGSLADFSKKIKIVSDVAQERGKVGALTETGLEGIPVADWWTGTLLRLLKEQKIYLSYVLVWRNAYDNPTHFYAPYPGHSSSEDFIKFRKDKYVLFENDLKDIYK